MVLSSFHLLCTCNTPAQMPVAIKAEQEQKSSPAKTQGGLHHANRKEEPLPLPAPHYPVTHPRQQNQAPNMGANSLQQANWVTKSCVHLFSVFQDLPRHANTAAPLPQEYHNRRRSVNKGRPPGKQRWHKQPTPFSPFRPIQWQAHHPAPPHVPQCFFDIPAAQGHLCCTAKYGRC